MLQRTSRSHNNLHQFEDMMSDRILHDLSVQKHGSRAFNMDMVGIQCSSILTGPSDSCQIWKPWQVQMTFLCILPFYWRLKALSN